MMDRSPSEIPPENLADLAEDHYFGSNPPPKDLDKHVALARDFIDYHSAAGRRLVLVTSGGTTVPLGMPGSCPATSMRKPTTNTETLRKTDCALHRQLLCRHPRSCKCYFPQLVGAVVV